MIQEKAMGFLIDRGGRRQIKDRRYRITAIQVSDRRTGLKRRNGLDRRFRQIPLLKGQDRRMEPKNYFK